MPTYRELIDGLLTMAGMVMEDASVLAILDDGERSLQARVAEVRRAGQSIVALAAAAELMLQLEDDGTS